MVYDVAMLVRTQIMMPENVYDSLRLEATLRQTSMSKLVVGAIGKSLFGGKMKVSGVESLSKLVDKAYKGKIPADLGTNDEYLYGEKK